MTVFVQMMQNENPMNSCDRKQVFLLTFILNTTQVFPLVLLCLEEQAVLLLQGDGRLPALS